MNGIAWLGQLYDGRIILDSEPLPADAPVVPAGHGPSRWKHAWKCEMKDRRLTCSAPEGVACRCKEVLHVEG